MHSHDFSENSMVWENSSSAPNDLDVASTPTGMNAIRQDESRLAHGEDDTVESESMGGRHDGIDGGLIKRTWPHFWFILGAIATTTYPMLVNQCNQ